MKLNQQNLPCYYSAKNQIMLQNHPNFKANVAKVVSQQLTENGWTKACEAATAMGIAAVSIGASQPKNEEDIEQKSYDERREDIYVKLKNLERNGVISGNDNILTYWHTNENNIHLIEYLMDSKDEKFLKEHLWRFSGDAKTKESADFLINVLENPKFNTGKQLERVEYCGYGSVNEENYDFAVELLDKFDDLYTIKDVIKASDKNSIPLIRKIVNSITREHDAIFDPSKMAISGSDRLQFIKAAKNNTDWSDRDVEELMKAVDYTNDGFAIYCTKARPNWAPEQMSRMLNSYKTEVRKDFRSERLSNLDSIASDCYEALQKGETPKYTPEELVEISQIAEHMDSLNEVKRLDEKLDYKNRKFFDLAELEKEFIDKCGFRVHAERKISGGTQTYYIPMEVSDEFKDEIKRLSTGKDRVIPPEHFATFVHYVNPKNKDFAVRLFSKNERNFEPWRLEVLMRSLSDSDLTKEKVKIAEKICFDTPHDFPENSDVHPLIIYLSNGQLNELYKKGTFDKIFDEVLDIRKQIIEAPDLYVNGEYEGVNEVNNFFDAGTFRNLMKFIDVYQDKTIVNDLMRMRFAKAKDIVWKFSMTPEIDEERLRGMLECKKPNGNEFSSKEKIRFMDVLRFYEGNEIDMTKLDEMIQAKSIDMNELNKDIFRSLLKEIGVEEEKVNSISDEELSEWDMDNIHLLASQVKALQGQKEQEGFTDLIKAATSGNFMEYIHDKDNVYGESNAITQEIFKERNFDYQKYINPDKKHEIRIQVTDSNADLLDQIAEQIEADVAKIRSTGAKGYFDSQMSAYIKGGEFVIPEEALTSKNVMNKLVKSLVENLGNIWTRAEQNSKSDNLEQRARGENTLTLKNHFEQRLKDISEMNDTRVTKDLDLTIKSWGRKPQRDTFQGTYTDCCIGMMETNAVIMPYYILNTAYNMIEVIDNKTGETIGNALCYFAQKGDEDVFIIDNIEIRNSMKLSNEGGKIVRDKMAEYAQNWAKDVTGKSDIKVYMSDNNNDVTTKDLKHSQEEVQFLGEVQTDLVYMDLYGGVVPTYVHEQKKQGGIILNNPFLALALGLAGNEDKEESLDNSEPKLLKRADIKAVCHLCRLR